MSRPVASRVAAGLLASIAACTSTPPPRSPPAPATARPVRPAREAPPAAPPEETYAGALAAARDALAIRIAEGAGADDLQARLDRKARAAGEALRLAQHTIADQPHAGRSFGHRLVASVLLDLATDLEALPGVEERVRRYREEGKAALRRCASFDVPADLQADCRARLAALEQPDPGALIAGHREGVERCLREAGAGAQFDGLLRLSVGERGVEAVSLEPRPPPPLAACLEAWARGLPLPGPLEVEVPLRLRAAD